MHRFGNKCGYTVRPLLFDSVSKKLGTLNTTIRILQVKGTSITVIARDA
jgi:hypothetical protein